MQMEFQFLQQEIILELNNDLFANVKLPKKNKNKIKFHKPSVNQVIQPDKKTGSGKK